MISLLPEESATLTSPKGKTALRHPSPPQAAKEQGDYLGRPAPLLPILGAEGRSGQQADIDEAAAGCGGNLSHNKYPFANATQGGCPCPLGQTWSPQ